MQVIAHNLESENPHAICSHCRLTNQVHREDIIFFASKQNRCLKSWRIDMPIRTAMKKLRFAVCFQISIVAHKLIIILSKVSQVVSLRHLVPRKRFKQNKTLCAPHFVPDKSFSRNKTSALARIRFVSRHRSCQGPPPKTKKRVRRNKSLTRY